MDKKVQQENDFWSEIFLKEMKKKDDKLFSSYWWEDYYQEMQKIIINLVTFNSDSKILEVGSGSGKGSYMLNTKSEITLLDISDEALNFAQHLSKKLDVKNKISYIQGDAFDLSLLKEKYNLVWSIGLVEHYNLEEIGKLVSEMISVTEKNGYLIVAVPNRISGPIIKAWILKQLKFIPGYKLDTEKFYSDHEITNLIENEIINSHREIISSHLKYCGSSLIMESPKSLITSLKNFINKYFYKFKFLKMYIYKIK